MYFEYYENNEMYVNMSKFDVKNKYVWWICRVYIG